MLSLYAFVFPIAIAPTALLFFFFNDTDTTEIYTLSLHDALPISKGTRMVNWAQESILVTGGTGSFGKKLDRKSTRLNSSHRCISYAVFCLKKKKKKDERVVETTKELKDIEDLASTHAVVVRGHIS